MVVETENMEKELKAQFEEIKAKLKEIEKEKRKERIQKKYKELISAIEKALDEAEREANFRRKYKSFGDVEVLANRDKDRDFISYAKEIGINVENKDQNYIIWLAYWLGRYHGHYSALEKLLYVLKNAEDFSKLKF